MTTRRKTKFIYESCYVAAVEVRFIEEETSWSPYLSLEDALRLDRVRAALQNWNIKAVARIGCVYTLEPVA
ncbi:MAG: hypothetical protein K2Y31_17165 [Burkholderiales bacterium]|jgi:hypothetical protein|nr:hypothetical protein [Burkholderiales bacterium]